LCLFDLVSSCTSCPFRTDLRNNLERRQVQRLQSGLSYGTFTCVETTIPDPHYAAEVVDGPNARHCAGALILLTKMGTQSISMRIAENLGTFQSGILDMAAPVYDSWQEMIDAATIAIAESPEEIAPVDSRGTLALKVWLVIGSLIVVLLFSRIAWELVPII